MIAPFSLSKEVVSQAILALLQCRAEQISQLELMQLLPSDLSGYLESQAAEIEKLTAAIDELTRYQAVTAVHSFFNLEATLAVQQSL